MDRAADYDEQSEVLFLFTEDADDAQPQTDNPPHLTPPQTTTSLTTSEPTQPPTTTLSADQPFWAEVYTLQPPHALMGVLTDLHVHRFILHQHLDSHTALAETPIGHQPLTDTLPPPIQRIIAIYHNNVQRAQHHTRLALNAIDTLARFPPAAYFTDPNLSTQAPPHPHSQTAPSPSHISPLRFYPIPTAAHRQTTLQDATAQTFEPWVSVLDNPLTPPGFNQSQQTTPRPDTHHRHVQTDIHAIVQLPSFAGILASHDADQPASSTPTTNIAHTASPNPTSATNKQPHDRWQYVNLIPTPTVTIPEHPHTTPAFPSPIGGTPRHRRSKTPPRSATPTRTRQPDPRTGSPIPSRTAPPPAPQQYPPTVHPLPKRPPPSLHQAHQLPATSDPLQPVPPATGWPNFQGGSFTPTPSAAPPTASTPPAHPWPAHYHVPTQQQPPTTSPPASIAPLTILAPPPPVVTPLTNLAPPPPLVTLHPTTTQVDAQGRPLPLHQQNYDPATDPWHADNH